jgi:hypothetical protein
VPVWASSSGACEVLIPGGGCGRNGSRVGRGAGLRARSAIPALRALGIAAMVAMVAWFFWFGQHGVLSRDEAAAATRDGADFGRPVTDEACLTEALRRGVACRDDARCEARSTAFLRGCLPASAATSDFCEGVPPPSELLPSGTWSKRVWDAQGRPHHGGLIADDAVRVFCQTR